MEHRMDIDLKLTVNEVNALLQVLGELPTKTGVYPLAVKVKTQADEQVKEKETPKGKEKKP